MTCLLKLIKRELLSLFGTVVLIGLILTIFSGAFMAVAFVYLDVPPGIEGYYKDIGTYFNVVLRNESLNEGLGLGGDWTYGCKFGLTTNVTIKGNQTVTAGYFQTKDNPFHNIADAASSTQGITLTPENAFRFENVWGGVISDGRWFSSVDEAVITSSLATRLGEVKVGDAITFNDRPFTVCGIIDSKAYVNVYRVENFVVPSAFFLCVDGSEKMDYCYLHCESASACQRDYDRLTDSGHNPIISSSTSVMLENINLCKTFFGSVALVLGIMVLFILYSLIAIFYRQRKSQICRYKLLGANGPMIASVYCIIAAVMAFLSCVAGAGFSVLFDMFFMRLCTMLFEFPFPTGFHTYIPAAVCGIMFLFIIILYFTFNAKIKNTHIAQEVKYE